MLTFLYSPTFTFIHDYWKNHSFDFCWQMPLLFNMLSRLVIAFLPSSKCFLKIGLQLASAEKAMATHSSPLAWKIPWTEEPGVLQSMGSQRVRHDWATSLSLFISCIGEGNGNPLQCSCLENPRDGGAWWAAVYGVAQSRTRLKWFSSSSSSSIYSDLGAPKNKVCHCFHLPWSDETGCHDLHFLNVEF